MFPVIDLGPFAIQAAGLILLVSLWLGIWLMRMFSNALRTNTEVIENSLLLGVVSGIVGARLGFLLQNPAIFSENPLTMFSLTPSMLNTGFGILVGCLSLLIYAQKKHLPLWPTLDASTPLMILLFAGVHLAQFANGGGYGLPTTLPWGIIQWNAVRHPIQIYALILTMALLFGFLIQTKGLQTTGILRSGILCLWIIIGLTLITLITRAFVEEKILIAGIDPIQAISEMILVSGFLCIFHRLYQARKHVAVFISLGSNLNPIENLSKAISRIESEYQIRIKSSQYKTQNVIDDFDQREFYNQVIEIETDQAYPHLRKILKTIERDFGRKNGDKHQVPLDLDILTYNHDVFVYNGKHIPDPNLMKYAYITKPLVEIASDFRHPATGESIHDISSQIKQDS